jgi:hypothetical protein
LSRAAALYKAHAETLLEQVGVTEISPGILDRHATLPDLERLADVMRSSLQAIRRATFVSQAHEALELIAYKTPVWSCRECSREFASRGLAQVKLRQ